MCLTRLLSRRNKPPGTAAPVDMGPAGVSEPRPASAGSPRAAARPSPGAALRPRTRMAGVCKVPNNGRVRPQPRLRADAPDVSRLSQDSGVQSRDGSALRVAGAVVASAPPPCPGARHPTPRGHRTLLAEAGPVLDTEAPQTAGTASPASALGLPGHAALASCPQPPWHPCPPARPASVPRAACIPVRVGGPGPQPLAAGQDPPVSAQRLSAQRRSRSGASQPAGVATGPAPNPFGPRARTDMAPS